MEFFVIENFPEDVDQFAKNLHEVVIKKFGGKTDIEIAGHIQGKQQETLHLSLTVKGTRREKIRYFSKSAYFK